ANIEFFGNTVKGVTVLYFIMYCKSVTAKTEQQKKDKESREYSHLPFHNEMPPVLWGVLSY
ncbi:MAG TPA: hypothetical protein PLN37_04495, partial [Smithella sp.]|nr:hypothetical protein [Smithella sp.]